MFWRPGRVHVGWAASVQMCERTPELTLVFPGVMTLGAVSFGLSVLQWLLLGDVCFRSSTELLSTSSFRVQLIGKVDPHSMDWCDGVLTTALRGDDRLGSRVCPFVLDAGMSLSSLAALKAASSPPKSMRQRKRMMEVTMFRELISWTLSGSIG